jgi:hypothetical protein
VKAWGGCGESELARLMGWSWDEFTARAEMVGSRIIVRGQLESLDELQRLAYARTIAPNVFVLGHLNPDVLNAALQSANLDLMRHGYSAHAIVVAGQLFIEGNVEDHADALKVEAIVAPVRELLEAERVVRGEEG